jgi:aminoglycoside phosphotransferase (APT) family kinase protein
MPAIPIDTDELQARANLLLDELAPGCTVEPISPLQGGASSITFSTTFGIPGSPPRKVVLKVAPAGLEPTRNRDVLRQANLQRSLTPTSVPVPEVLAEHSGQPPEIPPFYIMSFERGDCVEPNLLAPADQVPADQVRSRELQAARILGELHALRPDSIGVADEPEVTLEAELERWMNSFTACDEDLREGSDEVAELLAANTPQMGPTTVMHGDFRLGNTLSQGHDVISVIDWEIWSRGDARVDLAWFLMMANPEPSMGRPCPGMPGNDDLLAVYHDARGATVENLTWFAALVRYKQAAAAAFIARNARRRGQASASVNNTGRLSSARALLS